MQGDAASLTEHRPPLKQESLADYLLQPNMLDLLPSAVYICGMDGTIQQFNEKAVQLWGRRPAIGDIDERFCGAFRLYLADGTFLPHDKTPVADCLRNGQTYTDVEVIIERQDKSRVHVKVNVVPILDNEGRQLGIINCFHDITSLKELTNRLKQNEQYVRAMLEALPAAVYTCDRDGYVTFYNKAAAELWGRAPVIGKDMWCGSWEIQRPDGSPLPLNQCPMAVSLREKRPIYGEEIIVGKPDGSFRNVLPHPQPFFEKDGEVGGAINMLLDITEIRKTEEALKFTERKLRDLNFNLEKKVEEKTKDIIEKNKQIKKGEERYHKMMEEVEDYSILLMDKQGFIQDWNRGAEKIKGYTAGEIVGQNFRVLYLPEDQAQQLPEKLLNEASSKGKAIHEGWRVRKDSSKFWGSTVITALHDDNGEVIGFSKVTRDLSERREKEEKIRQYADELERKNNELEHFAYAASHDMKEPLRKIQFYGSTLFDNAGDVLDEKNRGYLMRMIDSAKRMQKLIEDILAYSGSNTPSLSFETVNLSQIVAEVLAEYKEWLDLYDVDISVSSLPFVHGIPFQLKQLFDNLIGNAIRYRHPERRLHIVITAKINKAPEDGLPGTGNEHNYLVSIIDNGLGFEPKYGEKIFEIFQRLHGRGTSGSGIGLTICKKIVQTHNGIIKAIGQPGKGARFDIYFPGLVERD